MAGKVIETTDGLGLLHLSNILNTNTGEQVTYTQTSEITTDIQCDGLWYKKYKNLYFKIDAMIPNPQLWGAKGDGVADDTIPFQAFANFIMNNGVKLAEIRGNFNITSKISFIATSKTVRNIVCDALMLCNFSAEDEAVRFQDWNFGYLSGKFSVQGAGGTTWANRTVGKGIVVANCGRFKADYITCSNLKYNGLEFTGSTTNSQVSVLRTAYCGSAGSGVTGNRTNLVSFTNTGTSASVNQRATVVVDVMPTGIVNNSAFCKINGSLYLITGTNTTNKELTLFPWVDTTVVAGASIELYIGAGLKTFGSDASAIHILKHDAFVCGIGALNQSLYPTSFGSIVMQSCGIGFAIGQDNNGAAIGGHVGYSYYEINDFDIVQITNTNVGFNFTSTTALSFAKCIKITARTASNNFDSSALKFNGITINKDGVTNQPSAELFSGNFNNLTVNASPKPTSFYNVKNDTQNINLTYDVDSAKLFAYKGFYIMGTGTGGSGQPTGTYTFNPPSGYSINALAVDTPLAISGMAKPTLFYIRVDGTIFTISQSDFSRDQSIYQTGATAATRMVSIVNPTGGQFKSPNSVDTGAIKIQLPSNIGAHYMIKGTVYQYDTGAGVSRQFQFSIGCNSVSMGNGHSATIIGSGITSLPVRWYTNGTTPAIYIGDLTSTWALLGVSIDSVQASSTGGTADVAGQGWVVSIETAFTGTLAATQLNTFPNTGLSKAAALTATAPTAVTQTSTAAAATYTQADIQKMVADITSLTTQLNSLRLYVADIVAKEQAAGQLS